jgi:TonB family protein
MGCALALMVAPISALRAAPADGPAKGARPVLVPPKLVENVEPSYPQERAGKETSTVTVVLELSIDATGKVADATVKRSAGELFDAAALDAGRRLGFTAATRDGQAIASKIPFSFSFAPLTAAAPVVDAAPSPGPAPNDPPAEAAKAASDAAGVAGASGREAPLADEVVDLEVKAERPPREVTRREIRGEEVRRIPGTNGDAIRAVENLPGVARPPSVTGQLIVRGSGPFDTQVFVDGTWIPDAYHFGGVSSVIPSELLERIDFYPGNFGVQYGRGMGGIVDVGLRSPRKDDFHGLVQVDLLDGRVMVEGPLGSRTRFLVAARRSWVDAWLKPVLESTGTGVSTAPVYYDGQAILEHDLTERTTLRLSFFGASDKLAITLDAPSPNDPVAGDLGFSQAFWRIQGRSDTRLGGGFGWQNTLSFGTDTQDVQLAGNYLHVTQHPLQLRSDLRGRIARGVNAVFGVDAVEYWVDLSLNVPPIPREGEAPSPYFARPASRLDFRTASFRPGMYAMLDLEPQEGLRLLPGVRVDHTRETNEWDVSPRIALRWDAHHGYPRTTLKGGVGVFYQPPQGFESVPPYGTAGLGNNRATHFSAGFEQELAAGVELSVEGFYKDLRNLVVQRDAAAQTMSGAAWANTGSGRTFGGELLLRARRERFFGWIAYTLSRSERRDAPGEPLRVFQYDQTHILTALGSYKLGRGWEIGARWRFVTGNPYTPYAGAIADYDAGAYAALSAPLYSARDPAFHRLDLRVDKKWQFKDWSLGWYLDVQNVYDRRNAEGQQYNFNYSRSQPVAGLPILPIVGLRGEL